jgi:hypothetical protein
VTNVCVTWRVAVNTSILNKQPGSEGKRWSPLGLGMGLTTSHRKN